MFVSLWGMGVYVLSFLSCTICFCIMNHCHLLHPFKWLVSLIVTFGGYVWQAEYKALQGWACLLVCGGWGCTFFLFFPALSVFA
jgi:hypothetical protein